MPRAEAEGDEESAGDGSDSGSDSGYSGDNSPESDVDDDDDASSSGSPGGGEEGEEDPAMQLVRSNGLQLLKLVEDPGAAAAVELLLHGIAAVATQEAVANFQEEVGSLPPLHRAAKAKSSQLCASLLMYGADLERLACGATPLQLACGPPYEPSRVHAMHSIDLPVEFCARTLLEHGADANAVDAEGLTTIQLVMKELVARVKHEQEEWLDRLRGDGAAQAARAVENQQAEKQKRRQQKAVLKERKKQAFLTSLEVVPTSGVKAQEWKAAETIKRHLRGHVSRRKVRELRSDVAASRIQRSFRGARARRELERSHPGHLDAIAQKRAEGQRKVALKQALQSRVMARDFGQCVQDVVRCLLNFQANVDVEDSDYSTLLHLAAQVGDTHGPPLIRMLLRYGAPSTRRNRSGLTPFELAMSLDHAACALALKPPPETLTVLEKLEREKGYFESPPTDYHVLSMSPFMKHLGDLLYCRPWPEAYRELLAQEQPQRADEELPEEPPVEFLATADPSRRGFEAPFEVRDREKLAALCTAASPRARGGQAPERPSGYQHAVRDTETIAWVGHMLELMCEHKEVEDMGKGNVAVHVHGYGLCVCVNIKNDEVWVYRYRSHVGAPPPGTDKAASGADEEGGEEEDPELEVIVAGGEQGAADEDGEDGEGDSAALAESGMGAGVDAAEAGVGSGSGHLAHSDKVAAIRMLKRRSKASIAVVAAVGAAGLLTGHTDGAVRLWVKGKQRAGEDGFRIGLHDGAVTCLAVVGRHAFSGSKDGSVRHWDTFTRRCVGVLPGHAEGVECMCLADDKAASPEPTVLGVAAGDGGIRLWMVDREDYACLCVVNCPQPQSLVTCICFDPSFPCLYAAGQVTDSDERKSSMLLCFPVAQFMRMHLLMPDPPAQPALRRIAAPPPVPEPEIEGLDDSDDDGIDTRPSEIDAPAQPDEEPTEKTLAEVLELCVGADLLAQEEMDSIMDHVSEGRDPPAKYLDIWEPQLSEYVAAHPNYKPLKSTVTKPAKTTVEILPLSEETKTPEDEKAKEFLWNTDAPAKEKLGWCGRCRRGAKVADKQQDLQELSKKLGLDPRKVHRMHASSDGASQRVQPKMNRTIEITRTEIAPHKGQRLPFIAVGCRMLIPGCLYSYTLEVKNGGGTYSWLSVEDPQEPFTEFIMCDPSESNVRVAERRKPDGRASHFLVWKVGLAAAETKKLLVIVRAKIRPVFTNRPQSCHTLFHGSVSITSMFWAEIGPVLGFSDGSIILFGAYVPPKDAQGLARLPWEKITPRAVKLAKKLAKVPVGRTRWMRCTHCLFILICCWNPLRWKCCKRMCKRMCKHNASLVMPAHLYSEEVTKEKLLQRPSPQGAYKNVNRRLLLGFKRSVRLRDGTSESAMHAGEPIKCLLYNAEDKELFFATRDAIVSIDVSARMNPWTSPSQVLPSEDYIDDLARLQSDVRGILPAGRDILVPTEDGSVSKILIVQKELSCMHKLWKKYVMTRMASLSIFLDDKLGALYLLGRKKEQDLALELHVTAENIYSVRRDGAIVQWDPDFQMSVWKRQAADRLPSTLDANVKFTSAGKVDIVTVAQSAGISNMLSQLTVGVTTTVLGHMHVFLVVCEKPIKFATDGDQSADDDEAASRDSYESSTDEDEDEDSGDEEEEDTDDSESDSEGGSESNFGSVRSGITEKSTTRVGFEEVDEPADEILLWNAKSGRPIAVEMQPPHPRGTITCVAIGAGFVFIGRNCGSLASYHMKFSDKRKEVLVAAQSFAGHTSTIESIRTVGDGRSDEGAPCSSGLLYSCRATLFLVHEVKSGSMIFKFDIRPGAMAGSTILAFDSLRISSATSEYNICDHVISAIGREVEVWSTEADVLDIVRFAQSSLASDDEGSDGTKSDDESGDGDDDDGDGLYLGFELGESVVETKVKQKKAGPPATVLHRHTYVGHTKPITCMQVHGNYAFTGCIHGSVRVWRCVAPWSCVLVVNATEGPVSRVLVPDLNTLWVAYGGVIRSWDLRVVHADLHVEQQDPNGVTDAATLASVPDAAGAEPQNARPETAVFTADTGASTTVFPLGHNGVAPVRSLAALPILLVQGGELRQRYRVFASCVDGSVYRLTPQTKAPVHQEAASKTAETVRGCSIVVTMGLLEYLQLVGITLTTNGDAWPPAMDSARAFASSVLLSTDAYTSSVWAGKFWASVFMSGVFLGAVIAQITTNIIVREQFNWSFGGNVGASVVLLHVGCYALRILDFVVGIVFFSSIIRPLMTTFQCTEQHPALRDDTEPTVCWGMGHLNYCIIAAAALYVYGVMSWRVHRAYGNCGRFASRQISDLLRSDRDNVHDTQIHHLHFYPTYINCSVIARVLSTAAAVFLREQPMAIACICLMCAWLLITVVRYPPFQVASMNAFTWGCTNAALATNLVLFQSVWSLKDHHHPPDHEQDTFSGFSHPEAFRAWTSATSMASLPKSRTCVPPNAADNDLLSPLSMPWIWAMLVTPGIAKVTYDWVILAVLAPRWRALVYKIRVASANRERKKQRRVRHLRRQLGFE
jgi:hypothetical protein